MIFYTQQRDRLFLLLNSAGKLTGRGCYSSCCFLQQGLQLVDRYLRCNVKSHARAAHERKRLKRERGRGIERPCHFPTLACSHTAGFACHSRWNCLLAGRWSCSQVKHFATSPWKWHVGKCWLFSQAYNVQPYKPAISNCRFYFFFRREGKTYSVPRRRSRDKTSIGRAWSQVTGPRYGHILKVKNDHRSKFSNLSNWKEEAWKKNQGFILWLTHGHILWLAYYHICASEHFPFLHQRWIPAWQLSWFSDWRQGSDPP